MGQMLEYPGLTSDSKLLCATNVLTTLNPFGEVNKGHLKLEGMILRDPYQALQKIKDEAYFRSTMSLNVGTREPLEVILIQV